MLNTEHFFAIIHINGVFYEDNTFSSPFFVKNQKMLFRCSL